MPLLEPPQQSLPKRLSFLGQLRQYREQRMRCSGSGNNSTTNSGVLSFNSLAREVSPGMAARASTVQPLQLAPVPSREESHSSSGSGSGGGNGDRGGVRLRISACPSAPSRDPEPAAGGISFDINKRLRHTVLNQHKLTNRFTGCPAALKAEQEYSVFVTRYQQPHVRVRMLAFAVLLAAGTQIEMLIQPFDEDLMCIGMRTIAPAGLFVLGAALVCPLKRFWRTIVMVSSFGSFCFLTAAMASTDVTTVNATSLDEEPWSEWQVYFHVNSMLLWLFVAMQAPALLFALDFVQLLVLLPALWLTYVLGALCVFTRWWDDSRGDAGHPWWHMAKHFGDLDSLSDLEGLDDDDAIEDTDPFDWNATNIAGLVGKGGGKGKGKGGGGGWPPHPHIHVHHLKPPSQSPRILLYCVFISAFGLIILLLALRRLNRFERQSFVNSYVLWNKVSTQSVQMRGKQVELLALFSNPRTANPALKPLQLGRELKFLLHSLPPVHLAIEPAASLADARTAIEEKNPRLILFSGHSFMGGLVFELDDGRLDCPPPSHFIAQLQPQHAPRLQCVCLNGCETAELAYQIVSELPWLKVICWPTITEDAAARAFAQGFYDAVGAFVSHGGEVQLELAYLAGLDRFCDEGFELGDPAQHLHPPSHPHCRAPVFDGCPGCCPPVHGVVTLLSFDLAGGGVHALMPQRLRCMRDEGAPLSWQRVSKHSLRQDLLETAAQCEQCEDPAHLFQAPPSGTLRTVEADPPPPPPPPPMAPAAATTDSETSTTGGGAAAGGGGDGISHRRSAIEEETAACGASLRPATGGRLMCGSLASSADAASARVTALADGV